MKNAHDIAMPLVAHHELNPGFTVSRFASGVGFALGLDTHAWVTWRMDGEHHAQPTVRRFATRALARNDLAARIRFYRLTQRESA